MPSQSHQNGKIIIMIIIIKILTFGEDMENNTIALLPGVEIDMTPLIICVSVSAKTGHTHTSYASEIPLGLCLK